MTIDPIILRTELVGAQGNWLAIGKDADPLNVGYAKYIPSGNDIGIAELLNATTGNGAGTVPNGAIPAQDFLQAIDPNEMLTFSALQVALIQLFMSAGQVPVGTAAVQSQLGNLFPATLSAQPPNSPPPTIAGAPNTSANLTVLTTRPCSRAETLFGAGTVIQSLDVAQALNPRIVINGVPQP